MEPLLLGFGRTHAAEFHFARLLIPWHLGEIIQIFTSQNRLLQGKSIRIRHNS